MRIARALIATTIVLASGAAGLHAWASGAQAPPAPRASCTPPPAPPHSAANSFAFVTYRCG